MSSKPSLCYILSYYSPNYARTRTLINALRSIDGLTVYEARNSSVGLRRYFETVVRLIFIRIRYRPDVYLLGFRGYEIYWLIRLLTLGHPLYYDHVMSPYDSLVFERKRLKPNSIISKFIHNYERRVLRNADVILTDTRAHKEHYIRLFNICGDNIYAIPLGVDEDVFNGCHPYIEAEETQSERHASSSTFKVVFFGSMIPLHGIDIILRAAALLKDLPIRFFLYGGRGKDLSSMRNLIDELELSNVIHQDWIDYEKIPEMVRDMDLCLAGPFGNTGQARRAVSNKTLECLAMSKATVIGNGNGDYGFLDKENCLLVNQANHTELANTIAWAFNNRHLLPKIGANGYALFKKAFSNARISECLQQLPILKEF